MASCATYLANKILDWIFGQTAFDPADTLYLHLFSTAPSSDGSGGTELTGANYSAIAITNDPTNFPNAAARQKLNGLAIALPVPTADWLGIVAWSLTDNAVGGNVYTFGRTTATIYVKQGEARTFPIGALIQNLT